MMISGAADCSSSTFSAVVLVRPIYDIVLYDAMPVADSTSIIFQCRIITGRSIFSRGHAKPTATMKAPVHRQYASVTGGTCPASPAREHDVAGPKEIGRDQQPPGRMPQ